MFRRIVIIGIGSLGGFFAHYISSLPSLQTLVLIDGDIVEQKNLRQSIYRNKDVGRRKVEALSEIINTLSDVEIITMPTPYMSGDDRIPLADLVFDCRDAITDSYNEMDAKIYISFRELVIDCRGIYESNSTRRAEYIERLDKSDIQGAAFKAFLLISTGKISQLISERAVFNIELDDLIPRVEETIDRSKNKVEIMYDPQPGEEKLLNLHENLPKLLEVNQNKEVKVFFGQYGRHMYPVEKIPPKSFASHLDVIKKLGMVAEKMTLNYDYNTYIVSVKETKDKVFVELLPETGGA